MNSKIKVKILTECTHCEGKAYLPSGKAVDSRGEFYAQYMPCKYCEGTGMVENSITLIQLIRLIEQTDIFEPDYQALAMAEPSSQYADSLASSGL